MVDYFELLEMAKDKIATLQHNEIFVLKDLFDGVFWARLDRGVRLELGRRFKYNVINNFIKDVVYIGKADNNSAKYKKIIE